MASSSSVSQSKLLSPFGTSSSSSAHHRLASQPNSPADSAIGTGSSAATTESAQSPPFGTTKRKASNGHVPSSASTAVPPSSAPNARRNVRTNQSGNPQPPAPPSKSNKASSLGLPILERVICERDYERVVKETEVLTGGLNTSREQLLAESRLTSREHLNQNHQSNASLTSLKNGISSNGLQESRRYYLYDPVRHEYRLYYAHEVRLRSESNLAMAGLGLDTEKHHEQQGSTTDIQVNIGGDTSCTPRPLRRRHSAGAGRLRKAVPPPKNGGFFQATVPVTVELAFENVGHGHSARTTEFPTSGHHEGQRPVVVKKDVSRSIIHQQPTTDNECDGNRQQQMEQSQHQIRRGAFERNSSSRKPLIHGRSMSDPSRRRQWSGGAKRAAVLKQQELLLEQQQKRMAKGETSTDEQLKPTPVTRQNNGMRIGQQEQQMIGPEVVTNQLLKKLLRPLHREEEQTDQRNIKADGVRLQQEEYGPSEVEAESWAQQTAGIGHDFDRERLLIRDSEMKPAATVGLPMEEEDEEAEKKKKKSLWECCFGDARRKEQQQQKVSKKRPVKSGPPAPARLQRYIGYLLCPLLVLVGAAAVAIVVIIWYI